MGGLHKNCKLSLRKSAMKNNHPPWLSIVLWCKPWNYFSLGKTIQYDQTLLKSQHGTFQAASQCSSVSRRRTLGLSNQNTGYSDLGGNCGYFSSSGAHFHHSWANTESVPSGGKHFSPRLWTVLNSNIINLIANIFWIFGVFSVLINSRLAHWSHAPWGSLRGICISTALQVNKGMFPKFREITLPWEPMLHLPAHCMLSLGGSVLFCPGTAITRNYSLWFANRSLWMRKFKIWVYLKVQFAAIGAGHEAHGTSITIFSL